MKRSLLLAAAACLLSAPLAFAAALPFTTSKTDKGAILADAKGMTLYTYDPDKKGVSVCYGDCAEDWPPLFAATGAMASGPYSLVTRKDGRMQWAINGMPLYYWEGDKTPGQVTGDGDDGIWHVVHASGGGA